MWRRKESAAEWNRSQPSEIRAANLPGISPSHLIFSLKRKNLTGVSIMSIMLRRPTLKVGQQILINDFHVNCTMLKPGRNALRDLNCWGSAYKFLHSSLDTSYVKYFLSKIMMTKWLKIKKQQKLSSDYCVC